MKRTMISVLAMAVMLSGSAFAGEDDIQQDKRDLRHDTHDLNADWLRQRTIAELCD